MRKFGLIGFPLSHSFSPSFFAEKFARENIEDCLYQIYPIDHVEKFAGLLISDPQIEGINVTIPYKKSVIQFLNYCSEPVAKIGACNCIKIHEGVLSGYNTDVIGFEKSLAEKLSTSHTYALILGTGGSAAAVEYVFKKLGIEYMFVSRNNSKLSNTCSYEDLSEEMMKQHTLVVNTTPSGMFPTIDECPNLPYKYITAEHYLFDLVYNPPKTLFLQKGEEMGATIKNGADMLIIQAEESWMIWNGEHVQHQSLVSL